MRKIVGGPGQAREGGNQNIVMSGIFLISTLRGEDCVRQDRNILEGNT